MSSEKLKFGCVVLIVLDIYFIQAIKCKYKNFFQNNLNLQKCCPENHYLSFNISTNFTCVPLPEGVFLNLEVISSTIHSRDCLDVLVTPSDQKFAKPNYKLQTYKTVTNIPIYPKCCPTNKFYDIEEHKCVSSKEFASQKTNTLFKIGLSQCVEQSQLNVIVDYTNFTMHSNLSVILNNGKTIPYGSYCLDVDSKSNMDVVRVCESFENICKGPFESSGIPCFRKCCPDGEKFNRKGICVPTFNSGISLNNSWRLRNTQRKNFAIIVPKLDALYVATSEYRFFLNDWGAMFVYKYGHWSKLLPNEAFYCVEAVEVKNGIKQQFFLYVLRRFERDFWGYNIRIMFFCVSFAISTVCLMLMFIVYLVIPDGKTLHGKSVRAYCVARFVCYTTWIPGQLNYGRIPCYLLDFPAIFGFLTSHTWLNVLVFNIWLSIKSTCISNQIVDNRKKIIFTYYCFYGWGFPACWIMFIFLVWYLNCFPEEFTPKIDTHQCFYDRYAPGYDYYIYFKIPQIMQISFNAILFVKIKSAYLKVKKEFAKLRRERKFEDIKIYNADYKKSSFLLKLTVLAGLGTIMDAFDKVTYIYSDPILVWLALIWDATFLLGDPMMFYVLIMNKHVYKKLKKKLFSGQ